MSAGKYNFTLEQGATFSKTLSLKDGSNVAINLTGCSVRGSLRPAFGSPVVTNFTMAVLSAVGGTITWGLSAAQTAALSNQFDSPWVYDLELVNADTTVSRILYGEITFSPEVTS